MARRKKVFDEVESSAYEQHVVDNASSLTFPEKLMYMMMAIERETAKAAQKPSRAPAVWDSPGTTIVVLESKELEEVWFPKFFGTNCKFKSFTRKLYRWGFKKVRYDDPCATDSADEGHSNKKVKRHTLCFQHPHFQRDEKNLMYKMENITCDKTRRMSAGRFAKEVNLGEKARVPPSHSQLPACSTTSTSKSNFQLSELDAASAAVAARHQINQAAHLPDLVQPTTHAAISWPHPGLARPLVGLPAHPSMSLSSVMGVAGFLGVASKSVSSMMMEAALGRSPYLVTNPHVPLGSPMVVTRPGGRQQEKPDHFDDEAEDKKPRAK